LKSNIASLDTRAHHIFSLNGVSFNYKRRQSDGFVSADGAVDKNSTHFGFIAQEVEGQFPELVGRASDGMRSVQYSAFVPLIIEGMKGQRAEAAAQRAAVESLRARIESLDRDRSSDGSSDTSDKDVTRRAASKVVSVKGLTGTGAVTAHLDNLVVSVKGLAGTGAVTARRDFALLESHSRQPHSRDPDADADDASAAVSRRDPTLATEEGFDLMSEVAARVEAVKAQLRAELRAELDAEVSELRQQVVDLAKEMRELQKDRRQAPCDETPAESIVS